MVSLFLLDVAISRLKRAFLIITQGCPMLYVEPAFRDVVSGKMVNIYRDRLHGTYWLATNPWGWGGRVVASRNKKQYRVH